MMNQLKSLEKTLAGALRREQMAETSIKQLEAEIEQLNRLVFVFPASFLFQSCLLHFGVSPCDSLLLRYVKERKTPDALK